MSVCDSRSARAAVQDGVRRLGDTRRSSCRLRCSADTPVLRAIQADR